MGVVSANHSAYMAIIIGRIQAIVLVIHHLPISVLNPLVPQTPLVLLFARTCQRTTHRPPTLQPSPSLAFASSSAMPVQATA